MTRYWLMKCEPDAYTIDDLERDGRTSWEGVRNYQARNFMRDDMQVGDGVLFYASNADPSGVSGLARIVRAGYPEPKQAKPARNALTDFLGSRQGKMLQREIVRGAFSLLKKRM